MADITPVVFLAFANSHDRPLATLKDESRAIYSSLRPMEEAGKIAIHREESVQFDELYEDLLAYKDRIVVFHYAGHADGSMLEFEQGNAKADAVAGLLGQQSSLKLVFLNGCATKDQVKRLHEAGIPAIIATAVKIKDNEATELAKAFYGAIARDCSIEEAFELAKSFIENDLASDAEQPLTLSVNRHPNFNFEQHEREQNFEFEWTLYVREDQQSDLVQWRLSQAQQQSIYQLEDSKGPVRDLTDKIIQFHYHLRQREVKAVKCSICGTDSVNPVEHESALACPVCFSTDTAEQTLTTHIPDIQLEKRLTPAQAATLIANKLSLEPSDNTAQLQLSEVLVPFWRIDANTKSQISGQRGNIKDVDASDLALSWEDVSESYDIGIQEFLVPAFAYQSVDISEPANWHWNFDTAISEQSNHLPKAHAYLPPTPDMQDAFKVFSDYLTRTLEDEAQSIVGGLQQRNIKVQTKYRDISLKTVFVPYVFAKTKGTGSELFCVNQQTGAVRGSKDLQTPPIINSRAQHMKQTVSANTHLNEKPSLWISTFSGIGIGIMVGLLLGLAESQGEGMKSVVAYFIGAVGLGLAALLGLNDRHFSNAKGLRIGAFGLAVTVSALSGIYVREHQVLVKGIDTRAKELRDVLPTLDDNALIALLTSSTTTTNTDGSSITTREAIDSGTGGLFSAEAAPESTCVSFDDAAFANYSAERLINKFKELDEQDTYRFKSLAQNVKTHLSTSESDQIQSLFLARDAACGYVFKVKAVTPTSELCALIRETDPAQLNSEQLKQRYLATSEGQKLVDEVNNKISRENQDKALEIMTLFFCPPLS